MCGLIKRQFCGCTLKVVRCSVSGLASPRHHPNGHLVRELANQAYEHPDGSRWTYSRVTLDLWIRAYREHGLDGGRPESQPECDPVRVRTTPADNPGLGVGCHDQGLESARAFSCLRARLAERVGVNWSRQGAHSSIGRAIATLRVAAPLGGKRAQVRA